MCITKYIIVYYIIGNYENIYYNITLNIVYTELSNFLISNRSYIYMNIILNYTYFQNNLRYSFIIHKKLLI